MTTTAGSLALALPLTAQQNREFDVVITGGKIVDGTGNPWFVGDVGVRGGVIAAVGLVHALVRLLDSSQFTLRMLLLGLLCLCVLLAVGVASQRAFLEPMLVYPDQSVE